jgi:hypothetical protein
VTHYMAPAMVLHAYVDSRQVIVTPTAPNWTKSR